MGTDAKARMAAEHSKQLFKIHAVNELQVKVRALLDAGRQEGLAAGDIVVCNKPLQFSDGECAPGTRLLVHSLSCNDGLRVWVKKQDRELIPELRSLIPDDVTKVRPTADELLAWSQVVEPKGTEKRERLVKGDIVVCEKSLRFTDGDCAHGTLLQVGSVERMPDRIWVKPLSAATNEVRSVYREEVEKFHGDEKPLVGKKATKPVEPSVAEPLYADGDIVVFTYPDHYETMVRYRSYTGQRCAVVRRLTADEADQPDSVDGTEYMYYVRFVDGFEASVFESELQPVPAEESAPMAHAVGDKRRFVYRPAGEIYHDKLGKHDGQECLVVSTAQPGKTFCVRFDDGYEGRVYASELQRIPDNKLALRAALTQAYIAARPGDCDFPRAADMALVMLRIRHIKTVEAAESGIPFAPWLEMSFIDLRDCCAGFIDQVKNRLLTKDKEA